MLKESLWMPSYIGGQNPNASIQGCFMPSVVFQETPPGIHCYIFFTYGYHVQDFFRHLFFEDVDNDWREMTLHHICALALYPGFLFSNLMGIGVFIAYIHDIADIPTNICRLCNRLDWNIPTLIGYLLMVITWAYTRLVILPMCIYAIITQMRFPENLMHFQPIIWIETTFLICM